MSKFFNYDGYNVYTVYEDVVKKYKSNLENLPIKTYEINDHELVYLIKESFAVYIGIINTSKYSFDKDFIVVIEDLLNNDIFKFSYRQFIGQFTEAKRSKILYKSFRGQWDEPIRGEIGNPLYIESKREYVNAVIPKLQLKSKFFNQKGYISNYIVFEMSDDEKDFGYAIYHTKNSDLHKIAIQMADQIEQQVYNKYYEKHIMSTNCPSVYLKEEWMINPIRVDKKMKELLYKRIDINEKNGWVQKKPGRQLGLSEHDLKYFFIPVYRDEKFTGIITGKEEKKILKEVKAGKYKNETRYEYIIPENKWKSEQMVFEFTKKIFNGKQVIYQYRPLFLKTAKGQMSYDVYIPDIKVAIEYQGKQHFEPVALFGGEENYKKQLERDLLKQKISEKEGVALVYIFYWDKLSPELIKKRISDAINIRNTKKKEINN